MFQVINIITSFKVHLFELNNLFDKCSILEYKYSAQKYFTCSYQDGLKQSKALLEEKSEDESDAEKLLELKHKDEESGIRYKSSR